MAELLKGGAVAAAITEKLSVETARLKEAGVVPTLAVLRVGAREDDLAYERGILKRFSQVGAEVRVCALPEDVPEKVFFDTLYSLNEDTSVHGILMFSPLPSHLDRDAAVAAISPEKDVDGCTDLSLAGVFANKELGYPPCTAQAAMEMLHYYGIKTAGKKAAVVGRSLVIGRPVAMMLMHENATVTLCHTKTEDVAKITREADIIVAAAGAGEMIDAEYVRDGQTVIDVGICVNEKTGKLCGDVKFDEVEKVVGAITPVPGGVGAVTTAVLASHVVSAAGRKVK